MGRKKERFFKSYFLMLFLFIGCSVPSEEEVTEASDFFYGEVYKVVAVKVEGQEDWDFDFSGDRQIIFRNSSEEIETLSGDLGQFSISLYDFSRDETNFQKCNGELVGEFEVVSVETDPPEEDDTYNVFDPYVEGEESNVVQESRYEISLDVNGRYNIDDTCPTYPTKHIVSIVRLDNKDLVYIDFVVGLQYYMELKNKETEL